MPYIVTAYNLDTAVAELSDARDVANGWLRREGGDAALADAPTDRHRGLFIRGGNCRVLYAREVSWADVAAGAHLPRPSESAAARFPNVLLDAYNRTAERKGFSK